MSNIIDYSNSNSFTTVSDAYSFDINTYDPRIILSFANINQNYSGPCLNVRRSSDNATQDIGFVNGYLDLQSLSDFVGSNNGYVTKWYDSSGNGNDFIQTSLSGQPRIVNNGALEDGLWFGGSDNIFLELAPNASVNNLSTMSIMSQFYPVSKNAGVVYHLN